MSKETHSFSVSVACAVGERAAIMIQHVFFLQKYVANNYKIEVPDAWAKRSLRELAATYSYLTEKQIRATLDSLIKDGFLFEKIENENKYDRSKSYQLSANGFILIGEDAFAQMGKWILPNGQNDFPERADDICPNGQMLDCTLCNEVSNNIITKEESEKNAFFGEAETLEEEVKRKLKSGELVDASKTAGELLSELRLSLEQKKEKLPPIPPAPPKKKETRKWDEVLNELPPDVRAFIDCTDGRVAWLEWLTYLKDEHRKTWKTAKGEARSIKHLFKLAGGCHQKARDLIDYASSQRWQGLYPIKEERQHTQIKNYKQNQYDLAKKVIADRDGLSF